MNNIYVFSDCHGQYNLWKQIQKFLREDDIAYCLGDCIDRGPDGIKILQEIFKDKRIIFLRGNHEDMLLNYYNKELDSTDIELLKYNGSLITLQYFKRLSLQEQENLINNLKNTYLKKIYINRDNKKIFLSHSGCFYDECDKNNYKYFLWNRKHLKAEDVLPKDFYIVHGHTPVQIFNEKCTNIISYNNNQKIDLDLASFESHKIALLNLNTFDTYYFFDNIKNI